MHLPPAVPHPDAVQLPSVVPVRKIHGVDPELFSVRVLEEGEGGLELLVGLGVARNVVPALGGHGHRPSVRTS